MKASYPKGIKYPNEEEISDCCFPDGAHEYDEQWTSIHVKKSVFVPRPKEETVQVVAEAIEESKHPIEKSTSGDAQAQLLDDAPTKDADQMLEKGRQMLKNRKMRPTSLWVSMPAPEGIEEYLYGLVFCRNIRDASVKRGSIQKSLFIVSRQPYYDLFVRILREAVHKCIASNNNEEIENILRSVYESINDCFCNKLNYSLRNITNLKLFGKNFQTNMFFYLRNEADEFPDASLTFLVKTFRSKTMCFWYAVLLGLRILFYSRSAQDVTQFCLALPLLVSPLHGYTDIMSPYVSLRNKEKITESKSYICGASNALFIRRKGM